MNGIKIGISPCLLGRRVRYDGGEKEDPYLTRTMGPHVEWVPVCPEVECGLPVPRETMRLEGDPEAPRLMTVEGRTDLTDRMMEWLGRKLEELSGIGLSGFILKSRSPSCGLTDTPVYAPTGKPCARGAGIFAGALGGQFPLLPLEDDERLRDPSSRESFIARIFTYRRWQELISGEATLGGLIRFHTGHKLLVMAHSPRHYTALGRLLSAPEGTVGDLPLTYFTLLMEGLRFPPTAKKNTNVLLHMAGYFKKQLTSGEREELLCLIEDYHRGLTPLLAPVTLINHYVSKYEEPYLARQVYLRPDPAELLLGNHS